MPVQYGPDGGTGKLAQWGCFGSGFHPVSSWTLRENWDRVRYTKDLPLVT